MSKYRQFIFENYSFDKTTGLLELRYSLDSRVNFTEKFKFDFKFVGYDPRALDRALQLLFFLAGVSYYKTYIPPQIVVRSGKIDKKLADFLSKTYSRGLGEFWHQNKLDPNTPVNFPINCKKPLSQFNISGNGIILGVGGGKDSLVSVELLRPSRHKLSTWSLNHRPQLSPLVTRIDLPHFWVEREWDKKLLELASQGAMNGHIPISSIFAATGAVVAILAGKRDIVVSNEASSNEPTLIYRKVKINHQYSKSLEFEQDFQSVLNQYFGQKLRYYSVLRPFSELNIARLFSLLAFTKYKDVFSSCNRAYIHNSNSMTWCGRCAKCAFVFLILTPFVTRQDLEKLWGGHNLLLDPTLRPIYRQLLGIEGDKPLDCVGEVQESRVAMRMATKIYPELNEYKFHLRAEYDYKSWHDHKMPTEIVALLQLYAN